MFIYIYIYEYIYVCISSSAPFSLGQKSDARSQDPDHCMNNSAGPEQRRGRMRPAINALADFASCDALVRVPSEVESSLVSIRPSGSDFWELTRAPVSVLVYSTLYCVIV